MTAIQLVLLKYTFGDFLNKPFLLFFEQRIIGCCCGSCGRRCSWGCCGSLAVVAMAPEPSFAHMDPIIIDFRRTPSLPIRVGDSGAIVVDHIPVAEGEHAGPDTFVILLDNRAGFSVLGCLLGHCS